MITILLEKQIYNYFEENIPCGMHKGATLLRARHEAYNVTLMCGLYNRSTLQVADIGASEPYFNFLLILLSTDL